MRDKRVTVEITDGLYYTVRLQENVEGTWVTNHNVSKLVHENQLEDTIATILRGPVFYKQNG